VTGPLGAHTRRLVASLRLAELREPSRVSASLRYASTPAHGAALRFAGLEDEGYRFHDLRHTCVSRLVAAGADNTATRFDLS
jgi:integrase